MADLEHSKRISYKATYSQIDVPGEPVSSGDPDPTLYKKRPRDSRTRALDKSSFVQSLRIRREELAALRAAT